MIERRQHRRVDLPVQVEIRTIDPQGLPSTTPLTGHARNVSLAGVYAMVPGPVVLEPGTVVSCSVNVPLSVAKQFPFSRLLGKGWVVRTHPAEKEDVNGQPEVGVAIAFTGNITALGTVWT